mmetsp:Transcript_42688/g.97102  ORF Transcript_42688/g.97102 Transcript_42688/m.97102 type:complete len:548 (+) Transcript_42688:268-1911(+)
MAAHGSASADACITGGDEAAPEFTPWEIRDEELTEAEDDVLADLPVPNSSGSGGGVLDGTERMKQDLSTKGIKGGKLVHSRDFEVGVGIGAGSVGEVYKAVHLTSRTLIAIKTLRADQPEATRLRVHSLKDILHEAEIMANVGAHPHVLAFVGIFASSTDPFLVIEYMDGGSLDDVLKAKRDQKGKPWRPPKVTSFGWCFQLAAALHFLHDRITPLVHRDVEPANLFVSADLSQVKLGDFGLCRALGSKEPGTNGSNGAQESNGSNGSEPESKGPEGSGEERPRKSRGSREVEAITGVTGSYFYMAPEVLLAGPNGDFSYDEKSDIFSAAVCMRSLVTGELAFEAEEGYNAKAVARRVGTQGYRMPLNAVKYRPMAKLITWMWSHDAHVRPSAGHCAAQLEMMRIEIKARSSKPLAIFQRTLGITETSPPVPKPRVIVGARRGGSEGPRRAPSAGVRGEGPPPVIGGKSPPPLPGSLLHPRRDPPSNIPLDVALDVPLDGTAHPLLESASPHRLAPTSHAPIPTRNLALALPGLGDALSEVDRARAG